MQSAQVRVWWPDLSEEDLEGASVVEGASRGMMVELVKQVLWDCVRPPCEMDGSREG